MPSHKVIGIAIISGFAIMLLLNEILRCLKLSIAKPQSPPCIKPPESETGDVVISIPSSIPQEHNREESAKLLIIGLSLDSITDGVTLGASSYGTF